MKPARYQITTGNQTSCCIIGRSFFGGKKSLNVHVFIFLFIFVEYFFATACLTNLDSHVYTSLIITKWGQRVNNKLPIGPFTLPC